MFLAAEFGPKGLRINAIAPGGTDTPMYRAMNNTAESQSFIMGLHALKRVATPDEIAKAVLFLASDDSSYVTGIELFVDGGVAQV